jgi:putative DNA primase/helicase
MDDKTIADLLNVKLESAPDLSTWALLDKSDPTLNKKGDVLRDGRPKAHLANVQTVFSTDPAWRQRFAFCELRQRVVFDGAPVTDADEAGIVHQLSRTYGIVPTTAIVHEALVWAASKRRQHPVREWLDTLQWDGVPRLSTWLSTYCAATDSALTRSIGRSWLVQAVARAIEPGAKADSVLILKGVQGCRKSTTCAVLGGEWFKDSDIDLSSKDRFSSLEGAWIYELGELDAMRKADARALKAFVSSQIDSYRPAYGRNCVDVPRTTVFIGTTNDAEFLVDATGSRRFWVVEVGQCDPDALEQDREQLWAEALHAYRAGEQWHLDSQADAERAEQAERFAPTDSWESPVASWLATQPGSVTLAEVWQGALGNERVNASKFDDMRLATIMRAHGWDKRRSRLPNGARVILWERSGDR